MLLSSRKMAVLTEGVGAEGKETHAEGLGKRETLGDARAGGVFWVVSGSGPLYEYILGGTCEKAGFLCHTGYPCCCDLTPR